MRDALTVLRQQEQQEQIHAPAYRQIVRMIEHSIEEAARNHKRGCLFRVPSYIFGEPIYEMNHCLTFLIILLRYKRYMVRYIPPNMLCICWGYEPTFMPPPSLPPPATASSLEDAPRQSPPRLPAPRQGRSAKCLDLTKI